MKLPVFLTGLVACAMSTDVVAAGGYSGGGGDYHDISAGAVWFTGNSPITYCIEKSNNFGPSVNDIQRDFESAAQTWGSYISSRRIQKDLPNGARLLNLNFQYTGPCQGSENLSLYLGVDTADVIREKKKFENPYAFANRESYDVKTGMGKGFIWFAQTGSLFPLAGDTGFPNWTKPYTLHGMMLHELGHVLGVGHLDGTIMRPDMMSTMQFMDVSQAWSQSRGKAMLTNIDDLKILKLDWYSTIEIEGRISYAKDPKQTAETFTIFMGRAPVGSVRMKFKMDQGYKLEIADDAGTVIFPISAPDTLKNEFSLLGDEFGILFIDSSIGYETKISTGTSGISGIGTIRAKTGTEFTIQYSINAEGLAGPVAIKYVDGKVAKDLFISNLKGSIL